MTCFSFLEPVLVELLVGPQGLLSAAGVSQAGTYTRIGSTIDPADPGSPCRMAMAVRAVGSVILIERGQQMIDIFPHGQAFLPDVELEVLLLC